MQYRTFAKNVNDGPKLILNRETTPEIGIEVGIYDTVHSKRNEQLLHDFRIFIDNFRFFRLTYDTYICYNTATENTYYK